MTLEGLGIPSAVVVTEAFDKLAAMSAKSAGFEALKRHALPHPLNPLPAEEIMRIADEHLPAIVDLLCEPAKPKA
jgi:hypothetical protein